MQDEKDTKNTGKDFDGWNRVKKGLEGSPLDFYFNEREIRFCSLGINVGSEQDGRGTDYERPILILKKYTSTTFLCLPLTTKVKSGGV